MNVIYNLSFSVALTTSTKLNDAFFIACIMMANTPFSGKKRFAW